MRVWVEPSAWPVGMFVECVTAGQDCDVCVDHNLELLRRLGELRALGRPLVVGTSRKSFIGKIDGSEADGRIGGTIASSVLAAAAGADVLRVHDVAEMSQAARVASAILG